MAKDILLYGRIDCESVSEFFENISEAQDGDETTPLKIRVNTGGGEPEYAWGALAKISELPNKIMAVDGKAYSAGTFACCYVDEVEALDVSQFMVHRAAYSEWFEGSKEYFTEPLRENLKAINSKLEKAFRNKVDVEAFENLKQCKDKNITVKDIFSMDSRIDVFFTAQDALNIKLISKIVKLTPSKRAEIETFDRISAEHKGKSESVLAGKEEKPNDKIMNLQELKQNHPAIFAEAVAIGVAQEKDRVEACLVYNELDPKAVKEAIESGKPLSQKQMAEFSLKSVQAQLLAATAGENAETVETTAEAVTTKENKEAVEKAAKEAKKLAEILAFAGVKGEKKSEMVFSSVVVE